MSYSLEGVSVDNEFDKLVDDLEKKIIGHRRYIHMHPEMGFDTKETENYIREHLEKYGAQIIETRYGVVGRIKGKDSTKLVALRADIDALPIQEENDVDYASAVCGMMHACGHDAHAAMLLGASEILAAHNEKLPMDVLLIFQPAEEGPSPGGAKFILEDLEAIGIVDQIKAIFGMHVWPDYGVGHVGWLKGALTASTDEFYITVKGKGGHAGKPQQTVDAISVGCKIVNNLESFMSRQMDPMESAVLSVGRFKAGGAINVVAETAEIAGTIRCLNEDVRSSILSNITRVVKGTCDAFGADCDVELIKGVPVTVTTSVETEYMRAIAVEMLGNASVFEIEKPLMGAEDFSWYTTKIPNSYAWIGCWSEGYSKTNHQPKFDIDEKVLTVGTKMMIRLALNAEKINKYK